MVSKFKNIPIGWKVKLSSDVLFFQEGPGVRKWQFKQEGVKLLNGGNINNNTINLSSTKHYLSEDEAYNKYKHFLIDEGDLLIACSGITINTFYKKIAFIKRKDLPLCLNTSTMRFKSLSGIELRYFFYYLQTKYFTKQIQKLITGSAQLNFGPSHMGKIEILLPPLDQQKKIAAILDAADAYRQKTKALIQKYDELTQSLFIDMFGDPVTNPMEWEKVPFGNFITVLTDYHSNGSYESLRKVVTLKSEPDYALMVRTTDLENNNFTNGVNYIDEVAYNHLDKSKVFGGEIIINKIGSAGKVYRMPKLHRPVSLGMNAFLLRFNELIDDMFLYFQLVSPHGEREIKKRVKGAVTKTIRKDAVREVPLISPPLELQNQFAERVQAIEAQKAQAQASLAQAEDLFNSLLQKAFKGELTS